MIKHIDYEFLKGKVIDYAWNNETHDIIRFTDGTEISFKQGYCYVGNDYKNDAPDPPKTRFIMEAGGPECSKCHSTLLRKHWYSLRRTECPNGCK